nr:biotin/lipoyl-binding protein [Marinicella sp. W31]MDC2877935.1 biotin/lipoyl-binding protein [Marinicella sp. W31]
MLELLFCSLFTIFPDYLYRRYGQNKKIGQEINLFSVWYELRWGITGCAMLTIILITTVFFYHPTSTAVTSFFRTVSLLPDAPGRVEEVYVRTGDIVDDGDVIFTLDDRQQRAAVDAARKKSLRSRLNRQSRARNSLRPLRRWSKPAARCNRSRRNWIAISDCKAAIRMLSPSGLSIPKAVASKS